MTPELMYLVWSAALTFVLVLIAVSSATLEVGLPKLAGNREGLPEMTGWAGRAQRAHLNMLESLMHPSLASPTCPRPEWTRRFAYRAMLVEPTLDSVSALMVAEGQFEDACDLEPEDAAEIYTHPH